jgi:hypothetical protein
VIDPSRRFVSAVQPTNYGLYGDGSFREDAIGEAATSEDLGKFGNNCPELRVGKVRLHAVDESAGDDNALSLPGVRCSNER